MPSANSIRKEILQALEGHILPALWQPNLSMEYVAPPLQFSGNITARLLKPTVPRKDTSAIEFPLHSRWPSANLHSSHYPYLGFLYEGTADEKTFITAEQATKHQISKGIYAIRWQAPSVLLFPPGMPRRGGDSLFWESEAPAPSMKFLWLSIGANLLIHTHVYTANQGRHVSHSLQINDPSAIALMEHYLKAMQPGRSDRRLFTQAMLLAVMQCVRDNLVATPAKIANTSRSPIPTIAISTDGSAGEACRDAAIYIQMHLHESLSLPDIASQVHFSPAYLNRLFRRIHGTSVMHYVRTQRVAAAKGILAEGSENVEEIAQLVGYKRANLFCRAFRAETGLTPGQFRRNARRDKSTFHDHE